MPQVKRRHSPATLAVNVTENVAKVSGREKFFHLRRPIDLDAHEERGRFVISYAPLNIDVYGNGRQEAIAAFAEAFEDAWNWLNESSDGQLSGDAKRLRRSFKDLVQAVDSVK
jgi:hypothetical protein